MTQSPTQAISKEAIMNVSKIKCELCGAQCHSIASHLREAHGPESSAPMTIEEYEARYPEAPLLSDAAKAMIEKRSKGEAPLAAAAKGTPAKVVSAENPPEPREDGSPGSAWVKKPMYQVFGLPKANTVSKSGKLIEVSVSTRNDTPDRVPVFEDYYPDPEVLRNVMIGLEFNEPTLVWGHAGVGKTSIFRYICNRTNRRLIRVQHTAETQEHKILGQLQVRKGFDDTGKAYSYTEFVLGDLPLAMKNGWVYLADEMDRAQPEVLSAYQSVLEGQPLHLPEADEDNRIIVPHPDFRFVATGNSNGMGDETGIHRAVQRQDAATFERFSIVVQLNYLDKKSEVNMLVEKVKIPQAHAERLVEFADKVRSQFPHEFPLTIGPRVLLKIATLGLLKGNFAEGVQLAYANRLPEAERIAAMKAASKILG